MFLQCCFPSQIRLLSEENSAQACCPLKLDAMLLTARSPRSPGRWNEPFGERKPTMLDAGAWCVAWWQMFSEQDSAAHHPDEAVRHLGETIIRSRRRLDFPTVFVSGDKEVLSQLHWRWLTNSRSRMQQNLTGRLIRGSSASMRISAVRSINEPYARMRTIAHGSVRGARIWISVNTFCLPSRPHVEKCDSHYPSDSSEAVDLRYCSPLQPRKTKVVLGIGRTRFPPSH